MTTKKERFHLLLKDIEIFFKLSLYLFLLCFILVSVLCVLFVKGIMGFLLFPFRLLIKEPNKEIKEQREVIVIEPFEDLSFAVSDYDQGNNENNFEVEEVKVCYMSNDLDLIENKDNKKLLN